MSVLEFRGIMGDGAFGVVHHLHNPTTNASFARKYFFETKKFELELENSKQVKCQHIVIALASGCEQPLQPVRRLGKKVNGPLSYIQMPLMFCGSLFDMGFIPIKSTIHQLPYDLSADLIYSWGLCVLHGLNYLHTSLFKIHGDIKPGNILIDRYGSAKIADLGAMQAIPPSGQKMHPEGTNYYMPPEVHSDGKLTFKIDVWSLGITLYEVSDACRPWTKIKPTATPHQIIELIKVGYVPFDRFRRVMMTDSLLSLMQLCLIKDCDCRPSAEQILDLPAQRAWRPPSNWPKRDWSITTRADLLSNEVEKVKNEKVEAAKAYESTIAELRLSNDRKSDTAKTVKEQELVKLQEQLQKKHEEQVKTLSHNSEAARKVLEHKLEEVQEARNQLQHGMLGLSKEIDILTAKTQGLETNGLAAEASYESKLALQSCELNRATQLKRKWKSQFKTLRSDLAPLLKKYASPDGAVNQELNEQDEIEEVQEEDEDGDELSPSRMLACANKQPHKATFAEAASVEVIDIASPPDLTDSPSDNEFESKTTSQKRKAVKCPKLNWEAGEEERLGADLNSLVEEVFNQEQLRIVSEACADFSVAKEAIHAFLELVAKNFKEVAAGTEIEYELSYAAGKLMEFFFILSSERWHRYEKFFAFVAFVKCTDPKTKQTSAYFGNVAQNVFQRRATKESSDYRVKDCLRTFEKYSAAAPAEAAAAAANN